MLAALVLGATLASALAPVVTVEDATNVSYTTADVKGTVNPEGQPTSWRFQYATEADFSNATDGPSGSTEASEPVSGQLTGLTPNTTYHLRLLAENGDGSSEAVATNTFTTLTVAKPTITGLLASEITGSTAHLSAEIDPGGSGDPAFDTQWHFECTPSCSGLSGGTVPAGPEQEVANTAKGLTPNTEYTLHLYATNAGGTRKATATFHTPGAGPLVIPFDAGPLFATSADLNAEVDPNGTATSYYFEWGTEDCSSGSCTSIPAAHEASAGASPYFTYVSKHLSGLSPQTTYHFRIVARNAFGISEGPDRTFTTPAPEPPCTNPGALGTSFLPDCRAYELVSPPDKSGIDVITQTNKTHISADGDSVTFSALGNFSEQVSGSSFDTEYLATRTAAPGTNGWSSHAINPPSRGASFEAANGNSSSFLSAFTPDLSEGIYSAWRPLTGANNVENVNNLYRVAGLRGAAPHATALLTDAYAPVTEAWPPSVYFALAKHPYLVGASTDLDRLYFETVVPLTPESPRGEGIGLLFCELLGACPNSLYENDGSGPRLVGRIPPEGEQECDDAGATPCQVAPSSQAAFPATLKWYTERTVSADGRRIYFQAPAAGNVPGELFLREDGQRTYRLATQAEFGDASRDGSRAFFITSEQLLPADTNTAPDVYMWDREAAAGSRFALISTNKFNSCYADSILGADADGHTLYFACDGALTPGTPGRLAGLYLWHDGQLAFIGNFRDTSDSGLNTFRTTWNFTDGTRTARVSPDARHLLFGTKSDRGFRGRGGFPGYDHANFFRELYLYDAATGRLQCATCNPSGAAAKSDAVIDVRANAATSVSTPDSAQALSDDGRFVFFNSREALLEADTNGTWDAYEFDSRTGAVHLLSSGTSSAPSYFLDATPDGRDVFIVTRERLSGWDTDGSYDLYDARVNGGLPEPAPVTAPCQGDSCLPAPATAPAPNATGSQSPSAGNPAPRRARCHKGKVRRRGRCVRKSRRKHHSKKQATHRLATHTNRRTSR